MCCPGLSAPARLAREIREPAAASSDLRVVRGHPDVRGDRGAGALEGWLWRIDQSIYDSTFVGLHAAAEQRRGDHRHRRREPGQPRPLAVVPAHPRGARRPGAGGRRAGDDDGPDPRHPSRDDPEADQLLAEAMRRYGQVVLPVVQATTGAALTGETRPLPIFADAAAAVGHDHVEFDPDGVARSVYLWEGFGAARHPSWPSPC